MKSSKITSLFLILVLVAGCSGGGGGNASGTPSASLVSIAITPANPSIALGTAEQFTATGTFSDNSKRDLTTSVAWTSSTTGIAAISNAAGSKGFATSAAAGSTTITAKSGIVSGFTTLTVIVPALVSIDVQPAISSILTGSPEQFTARGTYSDNSTKDLTSSVTWTSSAPDVATINSSGLVTAISTFITATTMIIARSGNASGSAILTVTGGSAAPANNVVPITVNGSLCSPSTSSGYLNKPCVSVRVCNKGTSTCQTITDILLDTGSFGLRIFKQALTNVSLTQVSSGAGLLAECILFGDGSSVWGPVQTVDVILGNETAVNVPIQVIDSTFGTVPSVCGTPLQSPTDAGAGFTGILGVGVFSQDCGPACAAISNNGIYSSCSAATSGSPCTGTTSALASQVQNPVSHLTTDNNGVIVQLPSVPSAGLSSADGILVLGIGTQTNNMPTTVTRYNTDQFGEIVTVLNGVSYGSIIDSGTNGLFFTPPSTGLLPSCASPASAWFCPSSTTTLSATNTGASGSPSGDVFFQIGNFISLTNSSNNVFSNIGGSSPSPFDWGLPFYFGRDIYVGIEGKGSSIGSGPYFAY